MLKYKQHKHQKNVWNQLEDINKDINNKDNWRSSWKKAALLGSK